MRRRALGIEWRDRVLTVVAAERARGEVGIVRVSACTWPEDEPLSPDTVRAFCEREEIGGGTATLVVSGSAAATKPLLLPPVGTAEQRQILRQNGERYFLVPPGERSYDLFDAADDTPDEGQGAQVRWAVAAAAGEVEALLDGFAAAAVNVRAVTAAESVYPLAARWLAGASAADAPARVVRVAGGQVDRVRYRDGRVAEVESSEAAAADGPEDGSAAVVLADPGGVPAGLTGVPPRPPVERPGTFAGALGAALAQLDGEAGPDLIPAGVRARRDRRNRLRTVVLATAAAFLLLLAGYLVVRERSQREARLDAVLERTRAEADAVIAMRDDLEAIRHRLSVFRQVRAGRNRYAPVLMQMSEALPADAWIVSFVSSDPHEAVVTGYARSATDALTALTRAPLFQDVRFERPTRSVELGGEAFEAFTMALELSPGSAPASGGGR